MTFVGVDMTNYAQYAHTHNIVWPMRNRAIKIIKTKQLFKVVVSKNKYIIFLLRDIFEVIQFTQPTFHT